MYKIIVFHIWKGQGQRDNNHNMTTATTPQKPTVPDLFCIKLSYICWNILQVTVGTGMMSQLWLALLWTEQFQCPHAQQILRKNSKQCRHNCSHEFTCTYCIVMHLTGGLIQIHLSWKQLLLAHCINCGIRWRNCPGWFMLPFIDVICREQGDWHLQVNPSMSTAIKWPIAIDLVPLRPRCPLPFAQCKSNTCMSGSQTTLLTVYWTLSDFPRGQSY